jgi:hypothetical protein
MLKGIVGFLLIGAIAGTGEAWAQSGGLLLARGVVAYRVTEYDSAATLLRQALDSNEPGALTGGSRIEAFIYLGAAEQLRGAPDSAASAFVRALAADPTHRIDSLIFPPSVSRAFDVARMRTAYSSAQAPPEVNFVAGSEGVPLQIFVSSPQRMVVSLATADSAVVRELYTGTITDSVTVHWNGMDNPGARAITGRLLLLVRPEAPVEFSGSQPLVLNVRATPVDTIAHPLPPAQPGSRERVTATVNPVRALILGSLAGASAILLPEVIGESGNAMPARYAVGATLGVAGVVGFFVGKRDQLRAQQAIARDLALDAWHQEVNRVQGENTRRLRYPRLRVLTDAGSTETGGEE